jgi:hypothetical protein
MYCWLPKNMPAKKKNNSKMAQENMRTGKFYFLWFYLHNIYYFTKFSVYVLQVPGKKK